MADMKLKPPYKNAPIIEAVIDIMVDLPPTISLDDIRKAFYNETGYSSPENLTNHTISSKLEAGVKEVAVSSSSNQVGFAFASEDKKHIFQPKLNGFTFSRISSYENWDNFANEAKRLWDVYRAAVKPLKVNRIAVRYVNRIDIPLPIADFEEYFRTFPNLSSDLPQGLAQFFMRLLIPYAKTKSFALINQTIDSVTDKSISIILDIDCYRTEELPNDDGQIWALFKEFKEQKNSVFEACVTDKARELFR